MGRAGSSDEALGIGSARTSAGRSRCAGLQQHADKLQRMFLPEFRPHRRNVVVTSCVKEGKQEMTVEVCSESDWGSRFGRARTETSPGNFMKKFQYLAGAVAVAAILASGCSK